MRASTAWLLCVLVSACGEPVDPTPVPVASLDQAAVRAEVLELVKEGSAQGVLRFGASLRNPGASAKCGAGMRRLFPRVERLRDAQLPQGVLLTDLFACVNCDPTGERSDRACATAGLAAEQAPATP